MRLVVKATGEASARRLAKASGLKIPRATPVLTKNPQDILDVAVMMSDNSLIWRREGNEERIWCDIDGSPWGR